MTKIDLNNITEEQAFELASLAFVGMSIKWKLTKRNDQGIWLDGIGHSGILYYFQMNEYCAINAATIFDNEEGRTVINHSISNVYMNCNDGVPYLLIAKYLINNNIIS
jgi:hypothetical protein